MKLKFLICVALFSVIGIAYPIYICASPQGESSSLVHSTGQEQPTQEAKQEAAIAQADQSATSAPSLEEIFEHTHDKLIPLETADNMLKGARSVSLNDLNDEQADKLMKVYRTIAEAYAANFRFKPAYLV